MPSSPRSRFENGASTRSLQDIVYPNLKLGTYASIGDGVPCVAGKSVSLETMQPLYRVLTARRVAGERLVCAVDVMCSFPGAPLPNGPVLIVPCFPETNRFQPWVF